MDEFNCISDQEWEAYSMGKLNAKQVYSIQQHCAQCEMCNDIKQGIDLMNDSSQLKSFVGSVKSEVDARTRKSILLWSPVGLGIAASLLLAMLLFWFLFPAKEQLALQKETTSTESESGIKSPEKQDAIIPNKNTEKKSSNIQMNARSKNTKPQLLIPPSKDERLNEEIKPIAHQNDGMKSMLDQVGVQESDIISSKDKESTPPNPASSNDAMNMESISVKESNIRMSKSVMIPQSKKYTAPIANNYQNNQNTNYNLGENENTKRILTDSTLAILNVANRLLDSNRFEKVLLICDSILNKPEQTYYSHFVLLKSKVILQQKGKVEATKYLEEQIKMKRLNDSFLLNYLNFLKKE